MSAEHSRSLLLHIRAPTHPPHGSKIATVKRQELLKLDGEDCLDIDYVISFLGLRQRRIRLSD